MTLSLRLSYMAFFLFVSSSFAQEEFPSNILTIEVSDVDSNVANYIATCNTNTCFTQQTESTPASQSYCDTQAGLTTNNVTTLGLAPNGCVRFLEDRSSYDWFIGQDDPGKPRYVPNCINGLSCMSGYLFGGVVPENATIEMPPQQENFINTDDIPGDFSIFLLYRHRQYNGDSCIIGHALYCIGTTSTNSLRIKINSETYLGNTANVFEIETWHLYEVYRQSGNLSFYVDGKLAFADLSTNENSTQGFAIGYFLSSFKGANPSLGDLEAVYVYNRKLISTEIEDIRKHVRGKYGVGKTFTSRVKITVDKPGNRDVGGIIVDDNLIPDDTILDMVPGISFSPSFQSNPGYEIVNNQCSAVTSLPEDQVISCYVKFQTITDQINDYSEKGVLLK